MPGDLAKSLLITAIHWSDTDMEMPPKQKLSSEIIVDFERWISAGAPDPREGKAPSVMEARKWETEAARQ